MNITTFVYLVLILLQCGTLAAKSSEDLCIELIGSNKSEGYWDDQLILNIGNNVATDTLNSIEVRVYAIGKLIDSIKIDTLFPMQSTVIQFHFTKTPHHGIVRVSFIKNQKISQLAIPFSKSSSLDFFLSRNVFISPLIAIFGVLLGAFLNHFLNLRKETHQATLQKQKVIFEKTEPILRDFLINISNERTATMLEKYYMSLKRSVVVSSKIDDLFMETIMSLKNKELNEKQREKIRLKFVRKVEDWHKKLCCEC